MAKTIPHQRIKSETSTVADGEPLFTNHNFR